jgi:hypothetical protein
LQGGEVGEAITRHGGEWKIPVLHGEKLSAVVFVLDYHQLQFDGPYLNAYTPPAVVIGGRVITRGMEGYRDRLCEQIAKVVVDTRAKAGEDLRIEFEDGSAVTISLRDEDLIGPESALFQAGPPSHEWIVWRGSEA